jgi:hypothetical protein
LKLIRDSYVDSGRFANPLIENCRWLIDKNENCLCGSLESCCRAKIEKTMQTESITKMLISRDNLIGTEAIKNP